MLGVAWVATSPTWKENSIIESLFVLTNGDEFAHAAPTKQQLFIYYFYEFAIAISKDKNYYW